MQQRVQQRPRIHEKQDSAPSVEHVKEALLRVESPAPDQERLVLKRPRLQPPESSEAVPKPSTPDTSESLPSLNEPVPASPGPDRPNLASPRPVADTPHVIQPVLIDLHVLNKRPPKEDQAEGPQKKKKKKTKPKKKPKVSTGPLQRPWRHDPQLTEHTLAMEPLPDFEVRPSTEPGHVPSHGLPSTVLETVKEPVAHPTRIAPLADHPLSPPEAAVLHHHREALADRSALVPTHLARGRDLESLAEPQRGPHQRFDGRGSNTLTESEVASIMHARLHQLETGALSVLEPWEAAELAHPIRIAERELQRGLLFGLLQTDPRLPQPVQTWTLSSLCQADSVLPTDTPTIDPHLVSLALPRLSS
jgi:hypothetical protein